MVKLNIIIAGGRGQDVEQASDILRDVALEGGLDVKKTDMAGLPRPDGSVVIQLGISDEVASPPTGEGEGDIMLAFEKGEAARCSDYMRTGASAVVNDLIHLPLSAGPGSEPDPGDDEVVQVLKLRDIELMLIKGSQRVAEMGDNAVLNVFMLGALSMLTPFNPQMWEKVIARRLPPQTLASNQAAFKQGRRDMLEVLATMPEEESGDTESHGHDCGCG